MAATRLDGKTDEQFRSDIYSNYSNALNKGNRDHPIEITLPFDRRLSSHSLNLLLIFLYSLQYYGDKRSFPLISVVPGELKDLLVNKRQRLTEKLRFYDSNDLFTHFDKISARYRPSLIELRAVQEELGAYKEPLENEYSSRMVSLSRLEAGSATEQITLAHRLYTFTNIVFQNLKGQITGTEAKEASEHIVFELCSNVYQHAGLDDLPGRLPKGFVCAQVSPRFSITSAKHHADPVVEAAGISALHNLKESPAEVLSISICDYGVGIDEKTRDVGQQLGPMERIIAAVSTDLTTKSTTLDLERWETEEGPLPLAKRGLGLLKTLRFLAERLGRLHIMSNGHSLSLFCKLESAMTMKYDSGLKPELSPKILEYFDVVYSTDATPPALPGTQILIEIPVTPRVARRWSDK